MKQRFLEMLDDELGPALQDYGFSGQGCEWKRHRDPVFNCIEVQLRSDQAACSVNLGVHLAFLPVAGGSSVVDFATISEADCEIQSRLAWKNEPEHWWDFDSLGDSKRICETVRIAAPRLPVSPISPAGAAMMRAHSRLLVLLLRASSRSGLAARLGHDNPSVIESQPSSEDFVREGWWR